MMTETMPKSIFAPRADQRPPQNNRERIEAEVLHLKKGGAGWSARRSLAIIRGIMIAGLAAVVMLFFAEPFIYAYKKDQAIRAYLYLKQYGTPDSVNALAASSILTERDVRILNGQTGEFRDYFNSPGAGEATAANVLHYVEVQDSIATGTVGDADPFAKIRYNLFNHWGLNPPVQWGLLNPDPRAYGWARNQNVHIEDGDNLYKTKKVEPWRLR